MNKKFISGLLCIIALFGFAYGDVGYPSYFEFENEICRNDIYSGCIGRDQVNKENTRNDSEECSDKCFSYDSSSDVDLMKNDDGLHTSYAVVNESLYVKGLLLTDVDYTFHTDAILEFDEKIYINGEITDISPKNYNYVSDGRSSSDNGIYKRSSLVNKNYSEITSVIDGYFVISSNDIFYPTGKIPGNGNKFHYKGKSEPNIDGIGFRKQSRIQSYSDGFYDYELNFIDARATDGGIYVDEFSIELSDNVTIILDDFISKRINDSNSVGVKNKINELLVLESYSDYSNHLGLSDKNFQIQYLLLYIKNKLN